MRALLLPALVVLLLSACAAAVTGSPSVVRTRAELPRTATSEQGSVCREASLQESPTEPNLWLPSSTPVPSGIPDTGFGPADAECEGTFVGNSDLVLLVWQRTFPVSVLRSFAARLAARNWQVLDQGADGGVFTAPSGIPAMYSRGPGQLHDVTVNTSSEPALTVLLWL